MGKLKLEKDKKTPKVGVEAPKDRVKTKKKQKAGEKVEKAELLPPVVDDSGDEAPEAIPIEKVDQGPPIPGKKANKKKNKKNKKAEPGALLKIKDTGKVQKVDPFVEKAQKMSEKLKKAAKSITPKDKDNVEIENPAEPPKILATKDAIRTAVIALRKATEEEAKDKKKLFDKDFKYCLQICATKIPKVPTRLVRLPLPHSLHDETDDVCLVVRDDVRGKQHDPELTVQKYEKILRDQKIDFIKKVMPFQEMRQNYGGYEMKRKLAQTYDVFLCDTIISGMVFKFTGKYFIEKRKTAVPVKIKHTEESQLKEELLKGIKKTCYKQINNGMNISIQVATHKHSVEQFTENIEAVMEQLKKEFPGGWANIKNIYVKPMCHSIVSLPLYITEIDPNRVPVPVVVGPKYRHLMKMANKLENESKKFKLQEGFKIEKKNKGKKRPVEDETMKDEVEKKIKTEEDETHDDSGVVSEEDNDVKEEENDVEQETDDKKPKVKGNKKNKKNKGAPKQVNGVENKPKKKKQKKLVAASPVKVSSVDKKPKLNKKLAKKEKKKGLKA